MAITTVFGLVGGVAVIVISILISGDLAGYVDFPSILITIGGTLFATILAFPGRALKGIADTFKVIFKKREYDPQRDIERIISMANIARREGLLALEHDIDDIDDEFVKKGIMLVVDGADTEFIKSVLETDIYFIQQRHGLGQAIFEAMAGYGPAFGMLGTVIGLINMLATIDDPTVIGANMSVALVTTFYGLVLAYTLFSPIAKKLKVLSEEECFEKELLLEGMLSIQNGENPRLIREKLTSFISKRQRRETRETIADIRPETKEIF
ncbi:MAG: motility protein A [Christensenellales bacterium]